MMKIAKITTCILLALMAFSVISIAIPQASAAKTIDTFTFRKAKSFSSRWR